MTPTEISAWAIVVATILGPAFGAFFAYHLARAAATRHEAAELFPRIIARSHSFESALRKQFENRIAGRDNSFRIMELRQGVDADHPAGPVVQDTEHIKRALVQAEERSDRISGWFSSARDETKAIDSALRGDCLALSLLFQSTGDRCIAAVQALLLISSFVDSAETPNLATLNDRVDRAIKDIESEIKGLYDRLRGTNTLIDA